MDLYGYGYIWWAQNSPRLGQTMQVFTAKFFKTKFGKVGRSANFESLYADAPVGGSGSGTTKLIDLDTAYADDDEALLGEL